MTSSVEALNLALQHHQAGRLHEAEALYRRILADDPRHAEAMHLLGVVAFQRGQLDTAIETISKAIAINGSMPEFHNNLGEAYRRQGKLDEAVACYRRSLARRQEYAEAHYNLGVALRDQGKLEEAVASFRQAVALTPSFAQAFNDLGNALQGQGQSDEAIQCYQRAVTLKPDFVEAYNNLGAALHGQRRLEEASAHYRQAVTLNPGIAEPHYNLGAALHGQGRLEEAMAEYQRALALKPTYVEAHNNLGIALQNQGRLAEAMACYRRALALNPAYVNAESQLLGLCQHLCDWEHVEMLFEHLKQRLYTSPSALVTPLTVLYVPSTPDEQLTCARSWSASYCSPYLRQQERLGFHFTRTRRSRLRIGYLSADFRQHPVAWLIPELFELHDRSAVEVFAYSYGRDDGSEIRKRLAHACDQFVDIRATSHVDAARRIYEDGVDVLVDLTGHTKDARTEIAALRPAPIQVNWLGYPGTMGADCIDYIIADAFIIPPAHEAFYSEKVVRLPDCYQINDRKRAIAEHAPTRLECGLPRNGFVFCGFNNTNKIAPAVFDVWMRVLREIPDSVLWLLEANVETAANLRREAQARGVSPERLVFAPRVSQDKHLARCRIADLFLDTLPYNGHVTVSDALWAGLPVLTCAGETFASRVAGSLLTAIGLPEMITYSLADYETRALRLARNVSELAGLRKRLKKNRLTTPLFDSERFTRHIECAYQMMWERYLNGEAPRQFDVPE